MSGGEGDSGTPDEEMCEQCKDRDEEMDKEGEEKKRRMKIIRNVEAWRPPVTFTRREFSVLTRQRRADSKTSLTSVLNEAGVITSVL